MYFCFLFGLMGYQCYFLQLQWEVLNFLIFDYFKFYLGLNYVFKFVSFIIFLCCIVYIYFFKVISVYIKVFLMFVKLCFNSNYQIIFCVYKRKFFLWRKLGYKMFNGILFYKNYMFYIIVDFFLKFENYKNIGYLFK